MEDRIRILENRQRLVMTLCAVIGVAAIMGMADDDTRVQRLQVVDDQGRVVLELGAGKRGGQIVLRSATGQNILRIEADDKGGSISTFQNDGRRAITIGTYQINATRRGGIVNVFDWNEKPSVTLGTGVKGTAPVSMGAGCAGGVIALAHEDEAMERVDLCLLKSLSASPKN